MAARDRFAPELDPEPSGRQSRAGRHSRAAVTPVAGGGTAHRGGVIIGPSGPLRVTFENSEEFAREFDRNLVNEGIFVPTPDLRPLRDIVEFVVVVPFSRQEIRGRGEVIYAVDAAQAAARGGEPGLGLHLLEFDMKAASEARAVIRQTLAEAALELPELRDAARVPARLRVRYRTREELETGLTRDISRGGVYLCTEEPYPVGTAIQLIFVHPVDGRELSLDGEVLRAETVPSAAGPPVGMGIRFLPVDAPRQAEVERFVRCVDLRRRALRAREIRGRVSETGIETVVHLFCKNDRDGELVIRRGDEAARIEFKDSQVVRAEVPHRGLSGEKAFYRILTWEDGDFEYRTREVDPTGGLNRPGERMLQEGLRLRAEVAEWYRRIPPDRRLGRGPEFHSEALASDAAARPLLDLLEGRATVGAALDRLGIPDPEAYRLLHRLQAEGQLRIE